MANLYWNGQAQAVKQVSTVTFGTYDATTTRKITIGGQTISAVDSGSTLTAALAALAVLLNAGLVGGIAHPYFTSIAWTSTATTIVGTASVAGVPFTYLGAVSGGTGTVSNSGVPTLTIASSGPNDWSTIANWYTALGTPSSALPTSGDTVIFANNAVNVCWGLATGVTGVALIRVEQSYSGKIGLNFLAFATSSDGTAVNNSYPEYRPLYAAIGCASLRIGDSSAIGSASGSGRLMFDLGSTTTNTTEIVNTSSSSADSNRPVVRLLYAKSASALNVRIAPGGIGVCSEVPGETSTLGTISIIDSTSTSKVVTGLGITLTTWNQNGGNNVLQSNQALSTINVNGGALRIEGAASGFDLFAYGGNTSLNSTGSLSSIDIIGGNVSGLGSSVSRTWSLVQIYGGTGGSVALDVKVITITSLVIVESSQFESRVILTASAV